MRSAAIRFLITRTLKTPPATLDTLRWRRGGKQRGARHECSPQYSAGPMTGSLVVDQRPSQGHNLPQEHLPSVDASGDEESSFLVKIWIRPSGEPSPKMAVETAPSSGEI